MIWITRINLIFMAMILFDAELLATGSDWQHCRQKSAFWCTQMCGLSGPLEFGHAQCSVTGMCLCPEAVVPPSHCQPVLTYDYHEVTNCHRRQGLCSFGQSWPPNSSRPLVCLDEHPKIIRPDQRFMKYCVCFRN